MYIIKEMLVGTDNDINVERAPASMDVARMATADNIFISRQIHNMFDRLCRLLLPIDVNENVHFGLFYVVGVFCLFVLFTFAFRFCSFFFSSAYIFYRHFLFDLTICMKRRPHTRLVLQKGTECSIKHIAP